MKHSKIVGGSTAKRVMACPGSVALSAQLPPQEENQYMAKGTLCHSAMDAIYGSDVPPRSVIGMKYGDEVLDEDTYDEKIFPAMMLFDKVDPDGEMEYMVEQRVSFGDFIPDVFGSSDLIGRIGKRAVVLDWKFGQGVVVSAEENAQGMFYAAAAMRTPEAQWAFDGAEEIEIIIIQPPMISRWVTTPARIKSFEIDLLKAVKIATAPGAPRVSGDHCRFCPAKVICPIMTGAVDRALKTTLEAIDANHVSAYLKNADLLEQWITDLRALAFKMLDKGVPLNGYKLVQKRASRKWVESADVLGALTDLGLSVDQVTPRELISPAVAEKLLKKSKKELPDVIVIKVSSGNTLAEESDPRPAVLQIGQQLTAALSKLI